MTRKHHGFSPQEHDPQGPLLDIGASDDIYLPFSENPHGSSPHEGRPQGRSNLDSKRKNDYKKITMAFRHMRDDPQGRSTTTEARRTITTRKNTMAFRHTITIHRDV
jgi:hypothetical protein